MRRSTMDVGKTHNPKNWNKSKSASMTIIPCKNVAVAVRMSASIP